MWTVARKFARVVAAALRSCAEHPRGLLWVVVSSSMAATSLCVASPQLQHKALLVSGLCLSGALAMGPRDLLVWMNWPLAASALHVAVQGSGVWPAGLGFLVAPLSVLAALSALSSGVLHALTPLATIGHGRGQDHVVGRMVREWRDSKGGQALPTIWYPACPDETPKWGSGSEYLGQAHRRLGALHRFALNGKVPALFIEHITRFRSVAAADAPLLPSPERLPVIVFSHGYTGLPEHYTYLAQSLAAHGFVVVGVQHTDGSSMLTLLPDGTEIPMAPLPPGTGWPSRKAWEFRLEGNRTRVADVSFAIDQLERENLDPASPLHGRLALDDGVGVLGHSFGAATSVLASWTEPRIAAAVCLDAWLMPLPAAQPDEDCFPMGEDIELPAGAAPPPPTLFVDSEHWQYEENLSRIRRVVREAGDQGWGLTLKGSTHHSFNDLSVVSPGVLEELEVVGPDARRMQEHVADLAAAFFAARRLEPEMLGAGVFESAHLA